MIGRCHGSLLALVALTGCGGPRVAALSFALEGASLPEGTALVSVAIVTGREFGFGCVGPSAQLPRVGVVSSTAHLVCGVDPDCTPQAAAADVVSPIPTFTAAEITSGDGVLVDEVPEGPALVFLEAFDDGERTLGIGCATTSVEPDEESVVTIAIEQVLD